MRCARSCCRVPSRWGLTCGGAPMRRPSVWRFGASVRARRRARATVHARSASSAGSLGASVPTPIPYRLHGERRLLDETALAGIVYQAGTGDQISQLPAVVRAALKGDTRPLIAAARVVGLLFSGSQAAPEGAPDLAV